MNSPDVSVVLPFGDHEHLVGKALHGIAEYFRAVDLRIEIIAVDQGSHDNSQPVLQLLRHEFPELSVILGRSYGAGARMANAPVLVLLSPEIAAHGFSESLTRAVGEVANGDVDMKLVDENLLVCSRSRCERIIVSASSRHHVERRLLQQGRSQGLTVRSYSPDEPKGRRISQVLAAVVPRSTGLHRAW